MSFPRTRLCRRVLGQGAPEMAPFYDRAPVLIARGFREDFALRIGEAMRSVESTRDDLLAFVQALGVPPHGALAIVARMGGELVGRLEPLPLTLHPTCPCMPDELWM